MILKRREEETESWKDKINNRTEWNGMEWKALSESMHPITIMPMPAKQQLNIKVECVCAVCSRRMSARSLNYRNTYRKYFSWH